MAEINWGALQSPDFAGNALRYRRAGEEDGRETATRNALKGYGTNPDGAIQDLMGVNPDVAMQLRNQQRQDREDQRGQQERDTRKSVLGGYGADPTKARQDALASGDVDLADMVSKMDDNQRKVAAENAGAVAAFANGLLEMPETEWAAQLSDPRNVEFLVSKGFTREQLAAFKPTRESLLAAVAQGTSLKDQLAARREDRTAEYQQQRLEEDRRHRLTIEGVASQNADSRRISATRPRARAGASNTPPSGFILD